MTKSLSPYLKYASFVLLIAFGSQQGFAAPLLKGAVQVSAGEDHSCSTLSDGTVACWGDNTHGQLGNGVVASPRLTPVSVLLAGSSYKLSGMTWVSAGDGFTCGLHSSGIVYCWGDSEFGMLGSGSLVSSSSPKQVWITEPVRQIAVGQWYGCALLNNAQRSVRCWGSNGYGQLGDGTTTDRTAPVDVVITEADGTKKLLTGVQEISAGAFHACAILSDGSAACWGNNRLGQLGNGSRTVSQTSPVAVVISESDGTRVKLTNISQIALGFDHSCVLLSASKSAACWGDNEYGSFGIPSGVPIYSNSPITVPTLQIQQLSAGSGYTCAALTDGRTTDCWGAGHDGQIGNGAAGDIYYAPQTVWLPPIKMISSGTFHSCAVTYDTGIKCWGDGTYGELGNGDDTVQLSPVDVLAVSP